MALHRVEASSSPESGAERVSNSPPFLDFLRSVGVVTDFTRVMADSHKMDPSYFSWQYVRKRGVPIGGSVDSVTTAVTLETGFEGYPFATVGSSDELISIILGMGVDAWNSIRRMHKHSYKTRNLLEKMIRGEGYSMKAAQEWSAIFGAMIAR